LASTHQYFKMFSTFSRKDCSLLKMTMPKSNLQSRLWIKILISYIINFFWKANVLKCNH